MFLCVLPPDEGTRDKSYHPVRVASLYLATIVAHNFVLACTRCDAENITSLSRLCTRPLTLPLAFSFRFALFLFLTPTPFSFPYLFRLA